jgi:flagellar hook-associated protein 3 FlgL
MKVNPNVMAARFVRDLKIREENISRYHHQLSSGRRTEWPSDDPVSTGESLRLRSALREVERHIGNSQEARNWLEVVDSALNEAIGTMQRVRELSVQAANGTLSTDSRKAVLDEAKELWGHLVQVGNSMYGDRYIFSGHKTKTTPFNPDGSYEGDSGELVREIGPRAFLAVSVPGDQAFGSAFVALRDLCTALETDDTASLSGTCLENIDKGLNDLLNARTKLGGTLSRAEMTYYRLKDDRYSISRLLSSTDDVDMAEAAFRLRTEENAYRMALAAGAYVIQPTLLDFLK